MLTVHHLRNSQSERIVWLCEELALPYTLKCYDRDPATQMAPPEYRALHFYGTAPTIHDGDLVLGETGAIVEYLCNIRAGGRLSVSPTAPNYAAYLYWLHFANATFLPAAIMAWSGATSGNADAQQQSARRARYDRAFDVAEQRLGEAPYFAGPEFTAADIMMFLPLTRARGMVPRDISGCPNLRAYLRKIAARPAFQSACAKADPAPPLT